MKKQQKKNYNKPVLTFRDIDFGVYGNYAVDDDADGIRDLIPDFPPVKKCIRNRQRG